MEENLRSFFTNILSSYSGINFSEESWDKYVRCKEKMFDFVDNENTLTLFAYILKDNDNVKYVELQTEFGNNFEKVVVFYKIKNVVLNKENVSDVVEITSLKESGNLGLYHSLNKVFTPILNKGNRKSLAQNNVEKQLFQLQTGLRGTILSGSLDSDPLKNVDKLSLNVILSLDNEVEFWVNAINNAKNKNERIQYEEIKEILLPLSKDFGVIDALPIIEVEDLLENAHNTLDDLWRHEPPFPKVRMENLMEIIASDVIHSINKEITKRDFWLLDFNTAYDILNICTTVGNKWITSCKQLTEVFWPNYSLHIWTGESFVPTNLKHLINGLEKILNIRTIHKQLVRLLTINEQQDLNVDNMFEPFKNLQILKYSPYTEQEWRKAEKQFEYIVQPAETRVAMKLKRQLTHMNANTRQLLHEFGRYSELICRPFVKQILQNERQYLLGALLEYINNINENSEVLISTRYDVPQVIIDITSVRLNETKVNEILRISEKVLDDLEMYDELKSRVIEILDGLKQQHNELFENWASDVSQRIKNNSLSLKETEPVVKFSENKLMKVNYSSRLVTLVNEVRQLSAMGYRIPNNIEETADLARKFMKYAKVLEQIANFHNTIGDKMIISQRPMMLASAVNLSKLVQEEEVVYWEDVNSVEKYIDKLKGAVEKLSNQNNMLTSFHHQVIKKIKDLENVDLIKHYQRWKDSTKSIREIMTQVQNKGFKSLQNWKIDLDKQLEKVLEFQYLKSLSTVHLYLPEIYTDLIYRDGNLVYSPDENVLKEKYDLQLKRFLDIPKTFRGISETLDFFSGVIERSKYEIDKVNKNTEELFDQLKSVSNHWKSWLTLENLDTTKLNVWQDWDIHFRASKVFGQEIAKLPSTEERVGCFIIGLSRLRNDFESHNRSYWDTLRVSLKDSIAQDVVKLQIYVDNSTTTLNKQLVTVEEIGEADASHANILRTRSEMEELYISTCMKAKTLATWNREQIDSVVRLQAAWDRLSSLLENHKHIISKQIETVKTTLNVATENLHKELERFEAKWDQVKFRPHSGQIATNTLIDLNNYLLNMKEKRAQFNLLMEQKIKIKEDYEKFNLEVPDFSLSDSIDLDLKDLEETWSLFEEFYLELEKLNNEEWIVFRKKLYKFEEFLFDWQTKLQKMEPTPLVTRILKETQSFQDLLPTLKLVRGEDFMDTHWLEVYEVLEITPKPIDILYLKDFLSIPNFSEKTKDLQNICKKAASEIIVRQALAELDQWEVQSRFILTEHLDVNKQPVYLIKDFKEILNRIGDNQSLLQSVKNSADFQSFFERASIWENKLSDLDNYLTNLAQIQRKWVYLEPIFNTGTLIHEKSRFERLDKEFRHLLKFVRDDPRVCSLCRYGNVRSMLENLQDQLGRCQKSLDHFLMEKRENFPRFLFLGDDDLLEIVGQSNKTNVIQSHLKKLFAGIHSIKFDENEGSIVAVQSLEKEVVELIDLVDIGKPVEVWMNDLVESMQKTLKKLLTDCLNENQNLDPTKYPSQILCLADSINFTSKTEAAISNMSLPTLLTNYKSQLDFYTSTEKNESDVESQVLNLKLKASILDTIHHISVIEELINENVTKITDWLWQKQLRYYSINGKISIKMVNAEMEYSYEYLGNSPKLVRTPLTDKCFLTLTQGLHLGMGGNPYGPAGTGKTESVKALGSLLGRQVLVFNCDEGIDASSMGRILSGLVKTGAWGCFDEFNRLDEATLSTISMYIQPIQIALKEKRNHVVLLNKEMILNNHCGIFVTLNPAGGSYGGRHKLPDNLKQLFRPIVMSQPDHEQIAKTLLRSDGFKNADVIAKKLIEIFNLSSQLLSKQHHYDWGLRALKTVLTSCGQNMKRNNQENELNLVVRALRMDTISKLTLNDSKKIDALIQDVFPSISYDINDQQGLWDILGNSCTELGLKINPRQLEKCVELYQQLQQRMGVAIVGPSSSGKTTIRNILFHALNKMGKTLKQKIFNPKSLSRTQLLGQIDLDTRQWIDGILPMYSLQVTSEPLETFSWIVCDGDIDPDWVESLNSVLDDNKLLSLPSGWRIQFGPNVNFIFETHELKNASPATISRMGIVFLESKDNLVKDVLESYNLEGVFESYMNDYFYKSINWVENNCEMIMRRSSLGLAKSAFSQVKNSCSKAEFCVNLINGLICQINEEFKEGLTQYIFDSTDESPPKYLSNLYYNEQGNIDTYNSKQIIIRDDLIITGEISLAMSCIRKWLIPGKEEHFLLIGPHGCAKTLILKQVLQERSDIDLATVHCSAYSSPQYLIHKLKQHCIVVNSNKGRVYKPKKGHLVIHFKNMHLLKSDKWGTNMVVEFLQQVMVYEGFFTETLEWVGLVNFTVVGTMSTPNNLSMRFSSSVHVYGLGLPELDNLTKICNHQLSKVINEILPKNEVWNKQKILKLTNTILTIYDKVCETFTTAENENYKFSPNDISYLCKQLPRYKNESNQDIEIFLLEITFYECRFIFGSRLISFDHRLTLDSILKNAFLSDWGKSNILDNLRNHFYVPTFTISNIHNSLSKLNKDDWIILLKKGILQYERDGCKLNLLFIPELLYLTSILSKTMSDNEGNILLIGKMGVGRKSAVKIISSLQNSKLVIPKANQKTFFNDLKQVLQLCGVEGEDVHFLLEDHIMNDNSIINAVNTLLCSGEIPGLFNDAELDSMLIGLKDEASRENFEGNLFNFFIKRVKQKLHIIICLDENNDQLWNILSECPTIYQKCDIVWISRWENSSMEEIPTKLLNELYPDHLSITKYFPDIHSTTKSTPFRYIELIQIYKEIYIQKKDEILKAGVKKLTEARQIVDELKLKASEQQSKLAEKQEMANSALDMISNTMRDANSQKKEMEILKKDTENENVMLQRRQKDIEVELAEVEPLIKQASAAVGNIKTEALSEIRSLRAPPEAIRDILEGVLRLMGIQDTSWNSMKTFLAKRGVKEDIKSFEASRISPESRQSVERLLKNKSDSFDPAVAKRASIAAAPLAAWVTANVRYSHVLDKIKPLTMEKNKLKRNLEQSKDQLGVLSAGLLDVDATVQKLKEQLSTYTKEAAEIEIGLKSVQSTLNAAQILVDRLNDEYERWKEQLKNFSRELENLPGNCLMVAGFITYLSGEPEDIRLNLQNTWKDILTDISHLEFSFENFLSSEREQLQWQSEGLGSDQLSTQNAIILLNTRIFPLIIDPTSTAITWLETHFRQKTIEKITSTSPKFINTLELSIRFGKILIVEDLEKVPYEMLQIFRKEFVYQGERKMINLCGKLIDFHPDFQIFLNTRNTQFKIPTDLISCICIVNFNITHSGLSEKLLMNTVRQQSPEIEKRRKELLRNREELQEKQFNLQNQLLEDLANSTGNILENKALLDSLNETKASSNDINQALEESKQIKEKLREEVEFYKDIASFASLLYFGILEYSKVNVLYTISIASYIKLFLKSILATGEIETTLCSQQKSLLQSVYHVIGRGLLKSDRLKFLLHLIHKVYPHQISDDEWRTFLGISTKELKTTTSTPSWIPDIIKPKLHYFQQNQPELYESLNLNEQTLWNSFINIDDPDLKFPQHCKLSEFQRVLLIQTLKPDRIYSILLQFVTRISGLKTINIEVPQLIEIYNESTCNEPILVLTTTGNDPSLEIRKLAESKIGLENYDEVAMGEGQENEALIKLDEAMKKGRWLILKNLHLVIKWLPILTQHLKNEVDLKFRLWLVTEPHDGFSPVLAQNCMKIAYEAPAGIKSNIQRTFSTSESSYVNKLTPSGTRIFFALSCIHALLQERRIYIPQGWSKWYEFSDLDLTTSIKLTEKNWSSQANAISWKFIKGLCLDAVYGGRIENILDCSILEAYLNQFLNNDILSHRWKPFGINNSIPMTNKIQEYINFIQQLPNKDLPSFFGLPENINRSWELNMSNKIIGQLRGLLEFKSIEKFNKELWQKGLAPLINLWKKLNQGQDFVKINLQHYRFKENDSPIINFLQEEFYNALVLIQIVHKDFTQLNRIIRSNTIPDNYNFKNGSLLLNLKIPETWLKLWQGPNDPNKYLRYLIVKTVKIRNWQNDDLDVLLKTRINLSLMFNPEGFLAAFKQHFSRKRKIPLDELEISTSWKPVEDFLPLEGLLISGALFDGFSLTNCTSDAESANSVPNCYFGFINKTQNIISEKILQVPLYLTSNRIKKISNIQVSCDPNERDKWIFAGVAFLLTF
nr:cytoplasmic dynein 2 heavy chain 1 [Onthophagus taurus]